MPTSSISSYEMLLKMPSGQTGKIPFTLKQGVTWTNQIELDIVIDHAYIGAEITGFDIMGGSYHIESFLAITNFRQALNSNGIIVMNQLTNIKLDASYFGPLPPNTVINQPYTVSKNGSRKLVRLSNGWLVAISCNRTSGMLYSHTSSDDGLTWTTLALNSMGNIQDMAVVAIPNTTKVGILTAYQGIYVRYQVFDVITGAQSFTANVESMAQSIIDSVSLAIDPTNGNLYAAWASKNNTLSQSYNIRTSRSLDGGATWSAPLQLTQFNTANQNIIGPSIVVANGNPVLVCVIQASPTGDYRLHSFGSNDKGASYSKNYIIYNAIKNYIQYSPSLVVDKNGVLHVVWYGMDALSTTTNNIFYAKSTDGGSTWTTAKRLTSNAEQKNSLWPSITIDKNGKLYVVFYSKIGTLDFAIYQTRSEDNGETWSAFTIIDSQNSVTFQNPSTLFDPTFTVAFGSTAPMVYERATVDIRYKGTLNTNNAPSIAITSPSNNQTLYENDTINISGDAYDAEKDQSVTVFYQINGEQRKVLAINASQTQITLSKQLLFKDGKLFDGETALTGTLTEGVAHTLKVWAVDSENSQSATIERTFYVVPNRAPLLSVDAVVPAGVVDVDKFKISGTSTDPDANANVKITKKVNANNPVEIYNGPGGAWEFDVSLAELVVGENTIVIEVIDNYGAKTSKTIKLKKNEVKTPVLHAVARYKITPPAGSAKGVLLFVERDEDMDLKVELSMTLAGEQEQYETLTADNTAPMPNTNSIVEDTYYYEATEPKDNIILKLSTTRPDATVNHKIHLISGAVE
ncbi:sialidase family protein [Lysinibacillus capsici]|uniref:sialidase family protein n=1 Tax=Lysinibacillus capsici TaxID=2115968 RepID=UPI0034E2F587